MNLKQALSSSPSTVTAPAKSWRDVLAVHPAANEFPLLKDCDPAALRALGDDIKKHGMQVPIVLLPDYKRNEPVTGSSYSLIDGRNRLDAMELVGVPFELFWEERKRGGWKGWVLKVEGQPYASIVVESFSDNPYALVASLNAHRRHLTAEQKRELISKLLKMRPAKSDRAIAADLKVDKNVVSRARKKVEATGAGAPVDGKRIGKDGKSRRMPEKKPTPNSKMSGGEAFAAVIEETFARAEANSASTAAAAEETPPEVKAAVVDQLEKATDAVNLATQVLKTREIPANPTDQSEHLATAHAEIAKLRDENATLKAELAELKQENADLREKLAEALDEKIPREEWVASDWNHQPSSEPTAAKPAAPKRREATADKVAANSAAKSAPELEFDSTSRDGDSWKAPVAKGSCYGIRQDADQHWLPLFDDRELDCAQFTLTQAESVCRRHYKKHPDLWVQT